MKLVEIRELDGPNLFLLTPAIKIEFVIEEEDDTDRIGANVANLFAIRETELGAIWVEAIDKLHDVARLDRPATVVTSLETDGHVAVAFGWEHRGRAVAIAEALVAATLEPDATSESVTRHVEEAGERPDTDDDRPELILDAERSIPTLGITGTNGKTTTTRMIAHIVSESGKRPGWCSTSGVFIDGEAVLDGDYTGPSGARRVLLDPRVDVAVLETARGGILLRGLGYQSNDVSVFINISADHLGLLGVQSVEGLARVKQTVIAVTKPSGFAVLNADDPLVWESRFATRATVFAVSPRGSNYDVQAHIDMGRPALTLRGQTVVYWNNRVGHDVLDVTAIPITYGGRARHMVENSMCAIGAAIAFGIDLETIRRAVRTFSSDAESNPGRLNAYRLNGVTVLLDYAHNEAGLTHLLELSQGLRSSDGIVRAVIGAAGDRTDESIIEIARLAGSMAGATYIRETARYLRGRSSNAELNALYLLGMRSVAAEPVGIFPSELDAIKAAVGDANDGDVVAVMSYEQGDAARAWLTETGAAPIVA